MVNETQHIINRKVILVQKGYSAARLAREIGVSPQAISQAIRCVTHSLRIHKAIANKMEVPLVEFWPELYGDNYEKANNENEERPEPECF